MYFMIRDFVFHWNNFKAFSSLAHVCSLHQRRENKWVVENNLCQILTALSVSPALSRADLTKTQKLAEDFISEYRKTPKWGHLSERLDSPPFPSCSMHKRGLLPPQPLQWVCVHPKRQSRAFPKHNKHYSVMISFYISVFYFLFCLKWPVPQEYNSFISQVLLSFFFFFFFFFFFRSR